MEEHSLVLVSTIAGGIGVSRRDGGSWILLPRSIAVGYIEKTGCFLPLPLFANAERMRISGSLLLWVPRSRFGRRVLRGWTGFPDYRRRLVWRKTKILGPDGDNAVANAGDGIRQRTWYADSDYRCPLRCCGRRILMMYFGILP